ncbi:XK-related protein 6-like [Amphiura filiformis]|uniref:XK-related protein 6-like n=1 Tax=Amphiura filiformis TaxID=82378 RepID=UPI003B21596F
MKISFGLLKDLVTLGLYLFDVVSDIVVGVVYIVEGDTWWGGLTLAFAAVTLVVTNVIGAALAWGDEIKSSWQIVFWAFAILQLGMLFLLIYKLREKVKENSTDDGIKIDILSTRLLEAFLESAPQVVLQMYIMTQMPSVKWLTVISVVFSLISLIWVTRSVYMEGGDFSIKNVDGEYKWLAHVCLLVWLLLTIPATVISMALFASYYRWIIFPVVAVYWVVNVIEIFILNYQHDRGWYIWMIPLFTFPSMFITSIWILINEDGFSSIWIFVFVITQYVFNTSMFTPWFVAGGYDTWYGIPAAVAVWGAYIVGIMFMRMLFYLTGTRQDHASHTRVPEEDNIEQQTEC